MITILPSEDEIRKSLVYYLLMATAGINTKTKPLIFKANSNYETKQLPYITYLQTSLRSEGTPKRTIEITEQNNFITFSIQVFGQDDFSFIRAIHFFPWSANHNLLFVYSELNTAGIRFFSQTQIQDLTAIFGDTNEFIPRQQLEITFSFVSYLEEKLEKIEEIEINKIDII